MSNPDLRLTFDRAAIDALAHDAAIAEHTRFIADTVADHARTLAPKRTGAGAASVFAQTGRDARGWFADVSWDQDHYYMIFAELGTSTRQATPFIRPAIDRYLRFQGGR